MKHNRTLILFYVLVGYVIVQFIWWAYAIIQLNHEIYILKNEIINLQNLSSEKYYFSLKQLHQKLDKRKLMVLTEGGVFLLILLWGIWLVRRSFIREMQLSRQQKNFLMSVTHELKSPIAAVKLQLETLLRHSIEKEKKDWILNNAINDTDRLNQLIENILVSANIDNAAYPIHKENINLTELLKNKINKLNTSLGEKVSINSTIQEDVWFNCDKLAMISIINNLLENAIKYSSNDKQSMIFIHLKKETDNIVFSVADNGIGISDEEKKLIFNKFYRSGKEETRQTKGTGLGLFITDFFVKKHDGKITVKNNQPQGSVFEVEFKI